MGVSPTSTAIHSTSPSWPPNYVARVMSRAKAWTPWLLSVRPRKPYARPLRHRCRDLAPAWWRLSRLAAVAGIVLSARIAAGAPTSGEMYDFYAIEAVVIGGTSNQGGTGGIIQTIIGVLIIGVLNNGMDLLNISGYYQKIVTGLVVVLAVIIDRNNINRNH